MFVKDPSGTYRPATPAEILAAGRKAVRATFRRGRLLSCPSDSKDAILAAIGTREHEVFACLFLDNRHRVLEFREMSQGTIDGASVHPRTIAQAALRLNAAALILAHNHPSGIDSPSRADELITQRLKDALALVDVRVLDHIIATSSGETYSFAEHGLI